MDLRRPWHLGKTPAGLYTGQGEVEEPCFKCRSVQLILKPGIRSSSGEHEDSTEPASPQAPDKATSV